MDTPEFVAPLVPAVVPMDTMNKKDLYAHLQEFHKERIPWGVTSKTNKDRLEDLHENMHRKVDYTQATYTKMSVESEFGTREFNVENPTKAENGVEFAGYREKVHEHLVVTSGPTEDEREVLDAVQNGNLGRVLSVTERKALERLIDNDFSALRNEMHALAKDVLEDRLRGVQAEFADKAKEAERLRTTAVKAITDANVKIMKAIEDAKAAGVAINGIHGSTGFSKEHHDSVVKAVVEGQAEAERKVKAENQSDIQAALHTLERQRLASQRLVLLAGISAEGQKLLDTIPDAKTLMIEAAQQRTAKAIEA